MSLGRYHKKHRKAGVNKDIIKILAQIENVEVPEQKHEVREFVNSLRFCRVAVPEDIVHDIVEKIYWAQGVVLGRWEHNHVSSGHVPAPVLGQRHDGQAPVLRHGHLAKVPILGPAGLSLWNGVLEGGCVSAPVLGHRHNVGHLATMPVLVLADPSIRSVKDVDDCKVLDGGCVPVTVS